MSNEDLEHAAVADANAEATPSTEGNDAQGEDEVEALLAEYESEMQTATPDTPAAASVADNNQGDGQKSRLDALESQQVDRDISQAVETIRASDPALANVSAELIEARLQLESRRAPALQSLWVNRHLHKDRFNAVLNGLGVKMVDELGSITEVKGAQDRDAVLAAAAGQSHTAPEALGLTNADVNEMSPHEFTQYKAKLDAATRA
jgi:hypothetical protein